MAPDLAEIHCHGGLAAVARICDDLRCRGASIESSEASLRQRVSQVDAECLLALTRTVTERTAILVAEQASGVLRSAIESLSARLTADGDSGAGLRAAQHEIDNLLRWSHFGRHLTEPWSVVLCGEPNAGKSSLMNTLAGFTRSIVSEQPGTTRDLVTAKIALDGWPIELSDTAGLRVAEGEIEAEGVRRATQRLAAADLTILLIDGSEPWSSMNDQLMRENLDRQGLFVQHKSDLPPAWSHESNSFLAVSSRTGMGIEELCCAIVARLVPEVPPPGTPVPVSLPICDALLQTANALDAGAIRQAQVLITRMLTPRSADQK
ncbi:MAG: 50S ribosome-binding GTPase [Planctomycetaceae bacterium]|nr:50S ribosome-binding GTPase [Planctomycetaceae bacterium]